MILKLDSKSPIGFGSSYLLEKVTGMSGVWLTVTNYIRSAKAVIVPIWVNAGAPALQHL